MREPASTELNALPTDSDMVALLEGPAFTPEEARAFDAYTRGLTIRFWPWMGMMLAFSALCWWPLDPLVFRDEPHAIKALTSFRPSFFLLHVALSLTATRLALVRKHATAAATLAALTNVAYFGWLMAEAGQGDPRWLYFAFITPMFSMLLLIPLLPRVMVSSCFTIAVLTTWTAHPASRLDAVGAAAGFSFLVFTCALCVFIGHLLFVQVQRAFHLNRRVDAQRRELRDLADHLEQRVEVQTRQLRALSDRARNIRSEQRREIARDLHDGIGQELTSLRLLVGLRRRLHGTTPPDEAFTDIDDQVGRIQSSLRRVLESIQPHHLEEAALLEALANLVDEMERRSGLTCRFTPTNASIVLPAAVNLAMFRIAQEAITNAVRHARARTIEVRLEGSDRAITLTVHDDGQGFDPQQLGNGFGTHNIQERAAVLGGSATWSFDRGTRLDVILPLESAS
jgi:signal transduction histidine kinase